MMLGSRFGVAQPTPLLPDARPATSVFASPVDQSTPKPSPLTPAKSVWDQVNLARVEGQPEVDITPQLPMTGRAMTPDLSNAHKMGFFDRVGDYLHQPGVAAALFRGGAETLQNGFGAGLSAAAGSMDQTHARETAATQQSFQNDMARLNQQVQQQQADQTGQHYERADTNDALRTDVQDRNYQGQIAVDQAKVGVDRQKVELDALAKSQGFQIDWAKIAEDRNNREATNWRHLTPSGSTTYATDAANYRTGQTLAAGIGSKGFTQTQTKTPGKPAVNHWFGADEPAVPETITTMRAPTGNDEIRYDAQGNAYRRDPKTGQPVRVR